MESNSTKHAGFSRETTAIVAIVAIATALRLINLDAGLWYDEALTVAQSVRLPPADLVTTYGSLNNHVLYTWLAKACVAAFGENAWSLRVPAVAFGVASIAAAWLLFRETGFRWAAIAAAALLAVSYHHVWFSQNARGYTGLLLFTTLAGFALLRALTTRVRAWWFAYAACFAVSLLIQLSAAFLLAAQGLVVLLHGAFVARKQAGTTFVGWLTGPMIGFGVGSVIVLAAFAPMIGGMIETFASVARPDQAPAGEVAEWKNPIWTILETVRSFGMIGAAIPVAMIFAGIGVWRMARAAPWIAAPYLIHIPLTLALLSALSMRIWPRYFFVDIAFLAAAVVIGAFAFAEFFARQTRLKDRLGLGASTLKIAGVAIMAGAALPLLVRNYEHPKQDFEGAYAQIEQLSAEEDQVTTLGLAGVYFREYRRLDWPAFSSSIESGRRTPSHGRLWVVTAFPSHTRANFPDEQAILDAEFELIATFEGTLSGGDVSVFRSRNP